MSATTFLQEGNIVDYTPLAAAKSGDLVWIGTLAAQVCTDIEAGKTGAARVEGIISVPKAAATVFAGGAVVHWNNTTKLAQTAAADGMIGVAVGGGANGDTYVSVKLNR